MVSPLLDQMEVISCLSSANGTDTYLVRSRKTSAVYVLKHISVPESQRQVQGLLLSGAVKSEAEAQTYYEQIAAEYQKELTLLQKLSVSENIDAYRGYQIEPKPEGVGYDLYLLADQRKTLREVIAESPLTNRRAVDLGLDLCGALTDLRKAGYVHCNVKPGNVYLSASGRFMIGDLGLFRNAQLKYASVPVRLLNPYSAPELFDVMKTLNDTVDIYSVGLILYYVYNGGHAPFEDERTSVKAAVEKRTGGETLPAPLYADYEMAAIILKACAYRPEERFRTPAELLNALSGYAERNAPDDSLIVPPIVTTPDMHLTEEALSEEVAPVRFADTKSMSSEFVSNFSPEKTAEPEKAAPVQDAVVIPAPVQLREPEAKTAAPKKKRHTAAWVLGAAGVLAAGFGIWYYLTIPRVYSMRLLSASTTAVTVSAETDRSLDDFTAVCSDTYGNTVEGVSDGQNYTFEGLTPGMTYTVRLTAGRKVSGQSYLVLKTLPSAEILSFSAEMTGEDAAMLRFEAAGAEAERWLIDYTDGSTLLSLTTESHEAAVSGLVPGKTYTFTLRTDDTPVLSGALTCTLSVPSPEPEPAAEPEPEPVPEPEPEPVPVVEVKTISSSVSGLTATVNWKYTGTPTEKWTVFRSDSAGGERTEQTESNSVSYTDLSYDRVYTVRVYCDGIDAPAETEFRTEGVTASGLKAFIENDGTVSAQFSAGPARPETWELTLTLHGTADSAVLPQSWKEHTVSIPGTETKAHLPYIVPNAVYDLTLRARGEQYDSISFSVPAANMFDNYGCSSVYAMLYLRPNFDGWTYLDLSATRNSYAKSEYVAFAMESLSKVQSVNTDIVCTYIVRDAGGKIVEATERTKNWSSMWSGGVFADAVDRTPQVSGDYTLEVYFNRRLVCTKQFSIR